MANKILVARGTKARIEEIKSTLATNELVYSTDTGELGVKKANGNIEYFMNATDINASKQDKLVAGDNITIDENNVISASGGFHRVRIFDESDELVTTQMVQEGESLKEENKLKNGYLFDYGTRNEFDYNTIITEDLDLTYSIIPPRYIQTTAEDFDWQGDYIGTAEYIILPEDKTDGYQIRNINVKGVATNGDYLTSTNSMFFGNNSLYLELDYLDTSNVTDMSSMFRSSKAIALDLSSLDTSKVTDMRNMFNGSQATALDLSNFDTSNVTTMFQMFVLSKTTTIDLSSFDTSNVTDMQNMFMYSKATTLDLSSFDTSNVTDMSYMFSGSQATTGYARTQEDADRFNNSSDKPSTLNFVVKDITDLIRIDEETITRNTNQELEVSELVLSDIDSRVKETDFTNYQNTVQNDITQVNGRVDNLEATLGNILALETANMIKSITRSGSNLFTITYYDDTTSSLLTLAELKTFIGEATQSLSGLMSAQDKVDLDTLMTLFDEDGDSVVNTIAEILAIFENYPEGADLVTALAGKVDKVSGKGLSTNDFTNNDKNKLDGIEAGAEVNPYSKTQLDNMLDDKVDKVAGKGLSTNDYTTTEKNKLAGIEAGAEVNEVNSVNGKQGVVVLNQDDISDGATYKQVSQVEKNAWNDKQDKLVAGDNITIDENTNVISASGIDLNEMAYFNYAGSIYGDKYSLLVSAWEHSLTVDPLEISATSSSSNPSGTAQYPNGLTEGVIIPQGVTTIGSLAFYNWNLNNQPLVIPNSVTSIGTNAFRNWTSNNQPLVIPNSVTSIGGNAFRDWIANNQPLVIPNSVTSIGDSAFEGWTSNNQPLTIPNTVTSIGGYAFRNWESNNQPLVIPDSVTSIGGAAFSRWTSNTQPLVIPNSVTSIGSNAFGSWSLVPYIEIQATTPPTLANANAFDNQNDAPIYVPDESVDDYKTATNWVNLADRIFSINDK